jgi:hypothetical protein
MTIANEILKMNNETEQYKACEEKSINKEQMWEEETTVYRFSDHSKLADNNGLLSIVE